MNDVTSGVIELSNLASRWVSGALDYSPRLLGAVLILVAGWFVAKGASVGTRRMLRSFSATLARHWRQHVGTGGRLSPATIGISAAIVQWTLLFFVLAGATRVLGIEAVSAWFERIIEQLPAVIAGGIIVFIGIVASQFAHDMIVAVLRPAAGEQAKIFGRLTQVMVVVTALIMGVGQAGIDTTLLVSIVIILLAGLFGGMAIAFGLGARDLVANVIGAHHARKLFLVGQTVQVGRFQGPIVRMTPTMAVIGTPEGQVTIPGGFFQREAVVVVHETEADDD